MRPVVRVVFAFLILVSVRCAHQQAWTAPGVKLTVADPAGIAPKSLEQLEIGDSLSAGISGATPNVPVEFLLEDGRGREWSYMRMRSDARGNVEPTLFWYQSGVIGTTLRDIAFRPDPAFTTFEEADRFFAENDLRLTVREASGRELARQTFRPRPRRTPFVYPSNADGILENAVDVRREDLHVSGRNFPAGATVNLFVVPNRYAWRAGDPLEAPEGAVRTIRLGARETSFTTQVWDRRLARPGAYDIVARIGEIGRPVLRPDDIVSFGEDTGVLMYVIINGNIVIDAAGRMKDSPAYFEFSDAFEKGQDVHAAVDPSDVPAMHPGGNYAAYWVVADQPEAYWDGVSPALVDVSSDGRNIARVKYFCINGTRFKIWPAATQAAPMAAYDVVVDFGSVPANVHTDFVDDNTYDKGIDFIDGYDTAGFWVFEDPGSVGPMPVGTVEYLDPNGISGITDPAGITGPTQPVTLGWARIMYPATVAGTGTPVAAGGPFPIALFLHGRHNRCDFDGAGPGLSGSTTQPCPQDQRHPSHEGYNYIMERLASHGIFSISINAYDIQPGLGQWDYSSRGRLVLKFLDKLRDWTNAPVDPFGGIFNGRLDMTRTALSGHSRGGEGVVSAQQLNATWPMPHSIVAVNTIAPTDQDSVSWVPTSTYFLLLGARDGDLDNMQGFRTYDRAFPDGMANRKPKSIAWVYGANHNYFNTVWTPTAELGTPNPWSGSVDDCFAGGCGSPISGAAQRQIGLTTISAFFRWQLQGINQYREILTGIVRPAAMDNDKIFWTLQDPDRKAVDDFEQTPFTTATNTLTGPASGPGFTTFAEALLNADSTDYTVTPATTDSAFRHDTIGLKLAWAAPQTYTTEIPAGPHRDVSAFTHLTLRAAKKVTGAVVPGPDVRLFVSVEDNMGRTGTTAWSSQFGRIPHPFTGSEKPNLAQMSGVRIPLRLFTRNNSEVDLTNIVRIRIRTEGAGEIGIDDVEFGK